MDSTTMTIIIANQIQRRPYLKQEKMLMRVPKWVGYMLGIWIIFNTPSLAQVDTMTTYHSLSSCTYLSGMDHPIQMARLVPKRAGILKSLQFHLAGSSGSCQVQVYGQEGGTNFPWFQKGLIHPIKVVKNQEGDTTITVLLSDSIWIKNKQFYIGFSDFIGDFGIKQDSTFAESFCVSNKGGNFYPTLLLNRDSSKWLGDNCSMAMDIAIDYISSTPPLFKEVTKEVGIPMNLSNQSIAWADVNGDDWEDLLLGRHFFINQEGHFKKRKLSPSTLLGNRISASTMLDMNNDGYWDILLLGTKQSSLLLNDGKGKFKAQTITIPPLPSLQAFSIADINKDAYPDLLVAQLWGAYPEPMPNYLLLNTGQSDFTDITKRLYPQHEGIYNFPNGSSCIARVDSTYLPDQNKNRRSRATQFVDYDVDGDVDIYITNYFLETDEFYENNGKGFFTSIVPPKPINQSDTTSNHGTGIAWYDYDNDGDMDVLIPQLAHPNYMLDYDHRGTTLYRNEEGIFKDVTAESGIQYEETHAGASFGDINNDGLVDIVITAYYGCRYAQVYLQQPDHTFRLIAHQTGLENLSTESDVCLVDYNKDGLLDIAIGDQGKFRLFQNQNPSDNNWLKINLRGTSVHRFGTNVLVKVYTAQHTYTQTATIGKGQKMQAPTTLHFGLGTATKVDKVEIYFDPLAPTIYKQLLANQTYILHE